MINLNLSGWNITKVTTMYYMFYECNAIETLNLNGWDFSNHPNVQYMFNSMTSLKTLLLRDWVFPETTQWGGGYQ
nr:BspA family leucine-rich repeat surface protein [bacterium]